MRDAIGEMIFGCGMFRPDVEKVMDLVVADEKNLFPKALRWSDPAGGYPPGLGDALFLSAKVYALEYIDEHQPEAWYRSLFVPPGAAA